MSIAVTDRLHGDLPKVRSRTICWSPKACQAAIASGKAAVLGAVDIETIPYKKPKKMTVEQARPNFTRIYAMTVVSYTFLSPDGFLDSYAFPLQRSKDIKSGLPEFLPEILNAIQYLNELPLRYTMHNGVYDCHWLIHLGMPVANYAYDSMTMFWSIWPDLPKRLDFVSSILLDNYRYWKGGRKDEDYTDYMAYAMSDTESTLLNTIILARYLVIDSSARRNFFHAHMRCLSGLYMSVFGMAVDEDVMEYLGKQLAIEAEKKLAHLRYVVANPEFNPQSPVQRAFLIYRLLGASPRNAKGKSVSKLGKKSTGAMAVKAIRHDHPLFRRVINPLLEAVTPAKQISNVVKMPRLAAGSTGSRFIFSMDGVGTTTTRYASRASALGHGTNGQNFRKDYRIFARADTDGVLIEIDFSAADDVFVGFESGEQKKIDLIRSGKDTHATNALIFFSNWTYDSIVAGKRAKDPRVIHPITGVRQITKKLVHGGHYLMAGATLLASAGREAIVAAAQEEGYADAGLWSQERLVQYCEHLDSRFRNHYPRFQREQTGAGSWYYDLRREVVKTGGFRTWNNYFQRFLASPKDDSTLRAVAATAGQAGTAGRINMVLDELIHGYIPRRFRDAENPHADAKPRRISEVENGITPRLQVHDSIILHINYRHPKWQDGLAGVFESFSRPCVIRDEHFNVGWEADVGVYWADKAGVEVRTVEDVESEIKKISLSEHMKALARYMPSAKLVS